jgi:choline dehydrogenase-like flavoprotein
LLHNEVSVDAVVVGSGCGGGVIAKSLVDAGFNVLVLEKGGYYHAGDFKQWKEADAGKYTLEKAGLLATEDGGFAVIAGSCVGGGSTINWSASFTPPTYVLQEWKNQFKLPGFDEQNPTSEYNQARKDILQWVNVNQENSYYDECEETKEPGKCTFAVNGNNRLLWKSAEKQGFQPEKIPRNVKNCKDCGHCCYGCAHRSKQSTIHALLEPILLQQRENEKNNVQDNGGKGKLFIIPHTYVNQVLWKEVAGSTNHSIYGKKKEACGVDAIVTINENNIETKISLRVKAHVFVSSCGSVHTPALLLRSRFQHPLIGKGLTLHPVVPVCGIANKDFDTGLARGVSMGVVVREPKIHAHQLPDDETHPVAIETPPGHPGLLGTVLPWHGGLNYKILITGYKHSAAFIGLPRDRSQNSNRVEIDIDGKPVLHYRVTKEDAPNIIAGIEMELRSLYAMEEIGAIFVSHSSLLPFVRSKNLSAQENHQRFEEYVQIVKRAGIQHLKTHLYSAHQMSSAKMAGVVENGPVTETGEMYECDSLFVADGSVLPTSLGINPMITIEITSRMISKHIIRKLTLKKQQS